MAKKTSDIKYNEFVDWARTVLSDALIREGLNGMCDAFQHRIMTQMHVIYGQGGFKGDR